MLDGFKVPFQASTSSYRFSTSVVGPPPTNGRGVFVVFLSFCMCFYSILSVSRCATGPFFYLVFSFLVFLFVEVGFGGGVGGGSGGA